MAKCARLVTALSAASAAARHATACALNRADVFNAFAPAKRLYVDCLKAGSDFLARRHASHPSKATPVSA